MALICKGPDHNLHEALDYSKGPQSSGVDSESTYPHEGKSNEPKLSLIIVSIIFIFSLLIVFSRKNYCPPYLWQQILVLNASGFKPKYNMKKYSQIRCFEYKILNCNFHP